MIRITSSRRAHLVRAAVPPAVVALTVVVLLRYPPGQSTFYPQCPVYKYLHLQCPGCGATRAIAALLHGHWAEALHLNALITLMLPFIVAYVVAGYRRLLQHNALRWPQPPPTVICVALAVAAVFAVVRNLPLKTF